MQLDAANTAIVLDSTADFPTGPRASRTGGSSRCTSASATRASATTSSSARTSSTSGCAGQPTLADDLAADARRLPRAPTRSSAATTRILSLHIPQKLSGTVESARRAGEELGGGKVRAIDSGTVSAGLAMLALAVQRRLERGRPTRRSTRSSSGSGARAASSSRSTRSSSSPGAAGSARRRRWPGRC